jgi:cobalt/nickel transport system permease protein
LRANAILLVSTSLLEPLSLLGILDAFRRLRLPESLIRVVSMSVRYLSLLRQEFQRLRVAMLSRGFRPRGMIQGYSTLAMALGMLLVRSLDRSDRIRRAMMARTLGPIHPMAVPPISSRDKFVLMACMSVLIGLAALEISLRWTS